MANSVKNSGFFSFLSGSSSDEETEYQGTIYFNKRTVEFSGTTLQLKNVSKFEQYGLKYVNKVSTIYLILSIILALAGLKYAPYGLVLTLFFGLNAYVGIKERMRPKLYGLTIELNSGATHHFLSKDSNGIELLFGKLTKGIENEETFGFSFTDNRVTNIATNYGAVGDHATSSGNTFS